MRLQDDEQNEARDLQNHFTAYLLSAIRRRKKDYLNKQQCLMNHEVSADFQEIAVPDQNTLDLMEQLPALMRLEDTVLLKAWRNRSGRFCLHVFWRNAAMMSWLTSWACGTKGPQPPITGWFKSCAGFWEGRNEF